MFVLPSMTVEYAASFYLTAFRIMRAKSSSRFGRETIFRYLRFADDFESLKKAANHATDLGFIAIGKRH
jgi:hypothetical protein